jgi:hypothetical protein
VRPTVQTVEAFAPARPMVPAVTSVLGMGRTTLAPPVPVSAEMR